MRGLAVAVSQVMREYDEAYGPGAALRDLVYGMCGFALVGMVMLGMAGMFDGTGG